MFCTSQQSTHKKYVTGPVDQNLSALLWKHQCNCDVLYLSTEHQFFFLLCISWVYSQHLVRITHLYPMSNKSLFQICFSQGLNQYLASKSNSFHCAACEKLCYNINNFCTSLDHLLTVVMLYKWTVNFLSRFFFFLIARKLHKQSNKILSSGLHHWSFGNQPLKMNAPVTTQLFILKYSTVQYTSRNL